MGQKSDDFQSIVTGKLTSGQEIKETCYQHYLNIFVSDT